MEFRKLRATVAIAAAAAMLLTMAMVTPALGKGPAPKTIQFDSTQYIVWEGHPTAYDIAIGLVRSVKTGTPSVTLTIGATGDAAVADQDYSAQTPVTVTFPRNQLKVFTAATIVALTDDDKSVEGDETISLSLSSPSSKWSLGTQSTATVTIHEEPAPQAPVYMSATPIGTDTLDIGWAVPSTWPGTGYPNDYALTFTLQRLLTDGTTWGTVYSGSNAYALDQGLDPGTTYTYQLYAENQDGATAYAGTFTGTTEVLPPTPTCSAEVDLYDPTVVHVTWTIPDDYVGDPVYFHVYSSSDLEYWTWVADTWDYGVDDADLTEVPYHYRVDAQTDNGTAESEPCSTIS